MLNIFDQKIQAIEHKKYVEEKEQNSVKQKQRCTTINQSSIMTNYRKNSSCK